MIRSLGISVSIAIGALVVAAGILLWTTREPAMLNATVVDQAMRAASVAPTNGALDAPDQSSVPEATVRLDAVRQDAQKRTLLWLVYTLTGALLATCGWLIFAEKRAHTVSGVQGQRSAGGLWWALFIAAVLLLAGIAYYALRLNALADVLSGQTLQIAIIVITVATVLTYYLGTAIAAPRVMRPSVPLATTWIR
ncbi:hypothetical protein [Phenylobacterium sp.]|uniref:hypothetical protein n=1 Tax=Phenylobacterium sp. TaxID=1871053 RepID=UPI002F92562A